MTAAISILAAMATDKRERQRANREAKRAEEEAAAKKATRLERAKRLALWAVLIAIVLVIANFVFGGEAALSAIAG